MAVEFENVSPMSPVFVLDVSGTHRDWYASARRCELAMLSPLSPRESGRGLG